jgi:hypothetical protein
VALPTRSWILAASCSRFVLVILRLPLVFGTGFYYMLKMMAKGPDVGDQAADVQSDVGKGSARFDRRPMSRATDPIDE